MRGRLMALSLLLAATGCLEVQDSPSKLVDLRVLGVQLEPPEILAPTCDTDDVAAFLPFAQPVRYRALIEDPFGQGRTLTYELLACPAQGDRRCEETRVVLAEGATLPGVLELFVTPALAQLPDGSSLLFETIAEDVYKGFGGVRVPLVLRVKAGDEEVYAQKLMVYACARVPGMAANVNPFVPALSLDGVAWTVGDLPAISGPGPFAVEVADPGDAQEFYVVPSLEAPPRPLSLQESWRIAWTTDYGRFDPAQTGGADLAGAEGRTRTRWFPPTQGEARAVVRVFIVVRDGRGGQAFEERRFSYTP